MSWEILRAEFKKGFYNEEDMAVVISDSYDKCVKTGGGGSAMAPATGDKGGLLSMLSACFASYGTMPFGDALDTGLTLYWAGATAGPDIVTPGSTAGYVKKDNGELDDFIDQLIEGFDNYHKQIIFTLPSVPPIVTVGYKVDS